MACRFRVRGGRRGRRARPDEVCRRRPRPTRTPFGLDRGRALGWWARRDRPQRAPRRVLRVVDSAWSVRDRRAGRHAVRVLSHPAAGVHGPRHPRRVCALDAAPCRTRSANAVLAGHLRRRQLSRRDRDRRPGVTADRRVAVHRAGLPPIGSRLHGARSRRRVAAILPGDPDRRARPATTGPGGVAEAPHPARRSDDRARTRLVPVRLGRHVHSSRPHRTVRRDRPWHRCAPLPGGQRDVGWRDR